MVPYTRRSYTFFGQCHKNIISYTVYEYSVFSQKRYISSYQVGDHKMAGKKGQVVQLQLEVNTEEEWEKLLLKDGLIGKHCNYLLILVVKWHFHCKAQLWLYLVKHSRTPMKMPYTLH